MLFVRLNNGNQLPGMILVCMVMHGLVCQQQAARLDAGNPDICG